MVKLDSRLISLFHRLMVLRPDVEVRPERKQMEGMDHKKIERKKKDTESQRT